MSIKEEDCGPIPDDTYFAIKLLLEQHQDSEIQQSVSPSFPLCFLHQAYSIIANRSQVDAEFKSLKLASKPLLKTFFSHSSPGETIVCEMSSYLASAERIIAEIPTKEMNKCMKAFIVWASDSRMSVYAKELLVGTDLLPPLSPENITTLVHMKFLIPRRDIHTSNECFWFSHNSLGQFVQKMSKGREQIMAIVKSSKQREIKQNELEKRLFINCSRERGRKRKHNSNAEAGAGFLVAVSPAATTTLSMSAIPPSSLPYGFKFHLYDVIGRGSLRRVTLPSIGGGDKFLLKAA